jgi:hypothetical protein
MVKNQLEKDIVQLDVVLTVLFKCTQVYRVSRKLLVSISRLADEATFQK